VVVSFIGGGNWSTRRKPRLALYKIQNYFNGNSTYYIVYMYMIDVIQVHVYIQRYYTIMRMKLHMIIR